MNNHRFNVLKCVFFDFIVIDLILVKPNTLVEVLEGLKILILLFSLDNE